MGDYRKDNLGQTSSDFFNRMAASGPPSAQPSPQPSPAPRSTWQDLADLVYGVQEAKAWHPSKAVAPYPKPKP